jgi:nucleoid-associated protein YgaU
VFRDFPNDVTYKYIDYIWKDGDSLGEIAKNFIGHSKYWWQILEINQLISDPFSIEPGTVIKVPYAN